VEDKSTECNTCDPSRSKGSSDNKSSTSSSSSSSSNKAQTPGKYDKYNAKDYGKKKRKLTAIQQLNDITTLQHEALNKLSERSYACQYPMKVHTSSGKYIDTIALIDITGDNSSN
jgi:hypothetical protein